MKTGFIGLGIMGKPMAKNLLKAGYRLVVFNANAAPMKELAAAGAETAASPKEVAEKCDIVVTMLPNSPHVKAVVLGAQGIIEGADPGKTVIDMSSIAPLASRESLRCWRKRVEMLDRACGGGEPRPSTGPLRHGRWEETYLNGAIRHEGHGGVRRTGG
jgi:2-hydroxy-3-oxopropionate reductase